MNAEFTTNNEALIYVFSLPYKTIMEATGASEALVSMWRVRFNRNQLSDAKKDEILTRFGFQIEKPQVKYTFKTEKQ